MELLSVGVTVFIFLVALVLSFVGWTIHWTIPVVSIGFIVWFLYDRWRSIQNKYKHLK